MTPGTHRAPERSGGAGLPIGGFPRTVAESRRILLDAIGPTPELTVVTGVGNIGDQLIWAGTRRLLDGHVYREIQPDQIVSAAGDTVLLPGSGAWSRHFHEIMPTLLGVAERRFRRVIVLPSSYDPGEDVVAECLSNSRALFFAREEESYRRIRGRCRAALAHDCAFFADLAPYRRPGAGRLTALRTDAESLGLVDLPPDNVDISVECDSLDDWLTVIADHESVVTDRAHVMIAAALLGKDVQVVPGGYHKVAALARTLPHDARVRPFALSVPENPPAAVDRPPSPPGPAGPRGATDRTVAPDPVTGAPRVCAVVLSRNRGDMLARCVDSLRRCGAGVRVHIVDNNSDERTRRVLRSLEAAATGPEGTPGAPGLTVQYSDRNLGCSGGRALGVASVDEEFVLFLDDDAELLPGALATLVADLDEHPEAQAVTAHVLRPDGHTSHCGGRIEIDHDYATFLLPEGDLRWDDPAHPPPGRCDWIGNTAALIRTSALRSCPLDPDLSAYYEDNDWALRLRAHFPDPFRRRPDAYAVHHFGPRPSRAGVFAHSRFLAERLHTMGLFLQRHDRILVSGGPELADFFADTGVLPQEPAAARLLLRYAASVPPSTLAAEIAGGDLGDVLSVLRARNAEHERIVAELGATRDQLARSRAAEAQAVHQRDHAHEVVYGIKAGRWWRLREAVHTAAGVRRSGPRRSRDAG